MTKEQDKEQDWKIFMEGLNGFTDDFMPHGRLTSADNLEVVRIIQESTKRMIEKNYTLPKRFENK